MLIDTNALSAWADGRESIRPHLAKADTLCIPSIELGKFYFDIQRSRYCADYRQWLRKVLPNVQILSVSHKTALAYSTIRNHLRNEGIPIPANDVWIASLAIQINRSLLSNDCHFGKIPNLKRALLGLVAEEKQFTFRRLN